MVLSLLVTCMSCDKAAIDEAKSLLVVDRARHNRICGCSPPAVLPSILSQRILSFDLQNTIYHLLRKSLSIAGFWNQLIQNMSTPGGWRKLSDGDDSDRDISPHGKARTRTRSRVTSLGRDDTPAEVPQPPAPQGLERPRMVSGDSAWTIAVNSGSGSGTPRIVSEFQKTYEKGMATLPFTWARRLVTNFSLTNRHRWRSRGCLDPQLSRPAMEAHESCRSSSGYQPSVCHGNSCTPTLVLKVRGDWQTGEVHIQQLLGAPVSPIWHSHVGTRPSNHSQTEPGP